MKISKSDLVKMINEEASNVLRERAGKPKYTRAAAQKGKRQLELYKMVGGDFSGNERQAVKTHQAMLAMQGYGRMMPKSFRNPDGDIYGETADGIYGPETIKATAAFQKSVGLTPDGLYGPDTHKAAMQVLNAELKPKASPEIIQHLTKSKSAGGMGLNFGDQGGGEKLATHVGMSPKEKGLPDSDEEDEGLLGLGGGWSTLGLE